MKKHERMKKAESRECLEAMERATLIDLMARQATEQAARAATELNQGILGVLTAHIAVVDQAGLVIAVNESWNRFARENGDTTFSHTGVGINYLSVCQKGAHDSEAREAGAGLESVLAGTQASFQMEYACHSLGQRRWFFMSVTALPARKGGAVISQVNITGRKRIEEALRESGTALSEAQRVGRIGSWSWNAVTDQIGWTDELYRIYDLDQNSTPPHYLDHLKLYTPESAAQLNAVVEKALHTGAPYELDLERSRTGGPRRWVGARGEVMRDADGHIVGLRGTAQDITERKWAEEEIGRLNASLEERVQARTAELEFANESLRSSEARFRAIFEQAAVGVGLIETSTGRFIRVNQRYCDLMAMTSEQMLAITFMAITHPDDLAPDLEQMEQMKRGLISSFSMEKRLLRPDGSVVWVNLTVSGLRSTGEAVNYHIAMVEDITGRRRAEEEVRQFNQTLEQRVQDRTAQLEAINAARRQSEARLRESEERFRQVTETIDQVFWMTTVDKNKMLYISPAYERIWGRSCESLYAAPRTWLDAIHPQDRPTMTKAVATKQVSGEYDVEYRILRPDGAERWIHDRGFPVRDASGKVQRIAGVAEDITETKRDELRRRLHYETARLLSGSLSLAEVIPQLLQTVAETFHWDVGEFWKMAGDSDQLRLAQAWQGPGKRIATFVQQSLKLSFSRFEGLPGRVFKTRQPDWIPDIAHCPHFARKDLAARARLRSAVAFPIALHHHTLGVMAFLADRVTEPDADLLEVFASVGSQIGQFMERKRLEGEILAISDREQRKFGYDLHDGLGQRLTALEMLSHGLAEDLQGQRPALAQQANRLNYELRETVTQARLISHSLAPVSLEGDGLMRGLAELAASTSRLPRVNCRFHGDPPVLIQDVTTATHLYRIAQEAVNNALKHGPARKIEITLTERTDGIELIVENNGCAIPAAPGEHGGLGLNVMRYRAEMIGARLSIESGLRKGARITCTLRKKI